MKLAFPTRDDQTIIGHFGNMDALIVIDIDDESETARERRDMSGMPACDDGHHDRPVFVVDTIKDCDVLIASGIGSPLVQKANAADVEVILTNVRSIDEARDMYIAGTLEHTPELAHHR